MNQDTAYARLHTTPPVIERYELKYVIPTAWVEPMSRFLEAYCELDAHSRVHADGFYRVNSLYFDTRGFRFLNQRLWGADRRFNMRTRAYETGDAVFAEIKYKQSTSVRKFRASLPSTQWPGFFTAAADPGPRGHDLRNLTDRDALSRDLFLSLKEAYAIEPKIFTCYKRRAFFSVFDEYARVTFDRDMRYRPQDLLQSPDPYSLTPSDDCLHYDLQTIYGDEVNPGANVVLELKTAIGAVPVWMIELVRRFELKQVGFSKYMNSSLVEHVDNGSRYMPADRMAYSLN